MKYALILFVALSGCTSNGTPNETCTSAVCPLGGHTYKLCTTPGGGACYYKGSDNKVFNCKSCSDCAAASNQVANWCSVGTTSGGTTSGSTTSGGTTSGTTNGSTGSTTGAPLNGCSGFLTCLQDCNDAACEDDCIAGATDDALLLFNQAFFFCPAEKFCSTPGDGGVPPCNSTDLDPTITFQTQGPSDACNACFDQFFSMSTASSQFQTQCAGDLSACRNDKP